MKLAITSLSELQAVHMRSQHLQIRLQLPQFPDQGLRFEERLNVLLHECGCSFGAAAMFVSIGLSLVWLLLQHGGIASTTWREVIVAVFGTILAAGVGKIVGQVRARQQLGRLIQDIIGEARKARCTQECEK